MEKEMNWHEEVVEMQKDEYGYYKPIIIVNDGVVEYWAYLDRPVEDAIKDFCIGYRYPDHMDYEVLEIGYNIIDLTNSGSATYRLGSMENPKIE